MARGAVVLEMDYKILQSIDRQIGRLIDRCTELHDNTVRGRTSGKGVGVTSPQEQESEVAGLECCMLMDWIHRLSSLSDPQLLGCSQAEISQR